MADIAATGGHAAAHGHDHPAHLQHHFDTSQQQFEASKLGMWLFLGTEVLFFSGLFCAYTVYRYNHPEVFTYAHKSLSVFWGALNTIILIASSFTMALGVWCAQKSNRNGLVICLILTLAGACGFMVIKAIEYTEKFQHGKLWGRLYEGDHHDEHAAQTGHKAGDAHAPAGGASGDAHAAPSSPQAPPDTAGHAPATTTQTPATAQGHADTGHSTATPGGSTAPASAPGASDGVFKPETSTLQLPASAPPRGVALAADDGHGGHGGAKPDDVHNVHLFFGIYFCLTGLHGIHVLAGMVVLTWLLIGALKGRYHAGYYTPVDLGGLYWHLVDLIWIYLFPLLYLIH